MANYELEFMNFDSETYKIQVRDTTDISEVFTELRTDGTGFTLNWQGAGNETYKAILESSFECGIQIDPDSIQLLADLAGSTMGRFEIIVSQLTAPATYKQMWFGYVLQDSMVMPDAYTDMDCITIQASDGFGELKDQEWTEFDIEDAMAQRTFVEWLSAVMQKMPLTYHNTALALLKIASNWYEDSHPHTLDTDDPFVRTISNEAVFVDIDDYNVVKGNSYYDILSIILEAFNLQIVHWHGEYLLIQQNTYTQSTTRAWNYKKDGTYLSTELLNLQQAMPARMSGGMYTYLAPIRKITTEYKYKQGLFRGNLFPVTVYKDTFYNLGLSVINSLMTFSGSIQLHYVGGSGDPSRIVAQYKVRIRNGSHYLNSALEWVTDSSVYVPVTTNGFKAYGTESDNMAYFNFQTFAPEDGQEVVFDYTFYRLEIQSTGAVFTPDAGEEPTMTHTAVDGTFVAYVVTGGVPQEGTLLYEAHVAEDIKYNLELPASTIGDGPNPTSAGGLRIINDSDVQVASTAWHVLGDSTTMPLHSLRCREMLALRRVTTTFYAGSFTASPDPFKGFTWEAKNWVWTAISWNANDNIYSGTALQLNYETDPS